MKQRLGEKVLAWWNDPRRALDWVDRKRQHRGLLPPQDWETVPRKCFVLSTGRTGTKFLALYFRLFEEVRARHEPQPWFFDLGVQYALGRVSTQQATAEIERGRRYLCRETRRRNAQLYMESNNRLFSLAPPIRQLMPGAKFVHVVRDGRDVVRSGMSRAWYTPGDNPRRLRACQDPADSYHDQWDRMSRFEKIAWLWQKKDGYIHDSLKGKEDVLHVRFEDIFAARQEGLFEVTRFLGFDDRRARHALRDMNLQKKTNASGTYAIPHWTNWSRQRVKSFDRIAGDHMRRYYPDYSP